MKKQLFLGSVTALMLSSSLQANWEGPFDGSYTGWDNGFVYDECCGSGKLLVDTEFLWWTPGTYYPFANNTFVNVGNAVTSPDAPFPSVVDTINEPYVRISEKWSPGVRVGLGWESANCDWQIWGRWTGYSNYARRVITSTPPAAVLTADAVLTNYGYLQPTIGDTFFNTISTSPNAFPTSATATYKLNYNVADLVFARTFQPMCDLELTPYAGVRASFFLHRQRVFFDGASAEVDDSGIFASLPLSSKFSNRLWGVGPRIGIGAVWGDWYGINLIGNISGAVLYGRQEAYARTSTTSLTADIVTSVARTRDRYNVILPNVQIQLGFGYKFDFNCEQNSIDLYAMWEGNYYWSASNVFLFERGLGLNGLTTGIAFNW